MDIQFSIEKGSLFISLPKEIDHHNAKDLQKEADRLLESHNIRSIVLDFKNTEFMDSSGIGVIMGRYKNIQYVGGTVSAIHVNDRILKILTLSGLYKIIHISNTLSE